MLHVYIFLKENNNYLTCQCVSGKSNTTSATCGAGTAYTSGTPELFPGSYWPGGLVVPSYITCPVVDVSVLFIRYTYY